MRLEILAASLKPGYREEDLVAVMKWNTEYHEKRGVRGIHYYVSEDRTSFVMTVPHQEAISDKIAKEWKESGAETQAWFREMMDKVFTGAGSRMYRGGPSLAGSGCLIAGARPLAAGRSSK